MVGLSWLMGLSSCHKGSVCPGLNWGRPAINGRSVLASDWPVEAAPAPVAAAIYVVLLGGTLPLSLWHASNVVHVLAYTCVIIYLHKIRCIKYLTPLPWCDKRQEAVK